MLKIKSRGTFIQASTYLNHIDPECLRYYYAAKELNDRIEDLDFNLEDFRSTCQYRYRE